MQSKQIESLHELEKPTSLRTVDSNTSSVTNQSVSSGKQSYAEKKVFEKQIRRAERKVNDCEQAVSNLEKELKSIEDRLSAGEADNKLFEQHGQISKDLELAMENWEEATMELENLKNN